MLLMENPNAYIIAQVPMSDTGTASAGMIVAEKERRNRKITNTTSAMEIIKRELHVATDSRIEAERSLSIWSLMRRRHLRLKQRKPVADGVDHRNRVGARLLLDAQHDGAVIVEPGGDLVVLDRVDRRGRLRRA